MVCILGVVEDGHSKNRPDAVHLGLFFGLAKAVSFVH
jgi:hypothetical protein